MFLSALPTQALAYVGDIQPVGSNAVKQAKLSSGSLALQNDYIRVIARKGGTLSTAPATESADPTDRQTPYCYFVTYGSRHITHPASLRLKSLTFVNKTPNGGTPSVGTTPNTGQKLASLPSASRISSYRFDGWYTAASGGLPLWNALLCASAFGLACAVFPRRKRRLG